jgi:hypothetical protein
MELFMAGGNYAASEVPFPEGIPRGRAGGDCSGEIGFSEAAVVRPAKAGAFCGSQSHRGKSRSPVAWVAGSVGKP